MAGGTKLKLPQDLCEHASIFKEMLDYPRFWDECLSESQKESLYSFLPSFPKDCNIEAELDKTLDMLFQRETHRFVVYTSYIYQYNFQEFFISTMYLLL